MPTYEFICEEHIISTEVLCNFNELNIKTPLCPKCQVLMKRKYQATPAIFKGSGFYTTDK